MVDVVRSAAQKNLPLDSVLHLTMNDSSSEACIHAVASVLRQYLRDIPGSVVPAQHYAQFVATNNIPASSTIIFSFVILIVLLG